MFTGDTHQPFTACCTLGMLWLCSIMVVQNLYKLASDVACFLTLSFSPWPSTLTKEVFFQSTSGGRLTLSFPPKKSQSVPHQGQLNTFGSPRPYVLCEKVSTSCTFLGEQRHSCFSAQLEQNELYPFFIDILNLSGLSLLGCSTFLFIMNYNYI